MNPPSNRRRWLAWWGAAMSIAMTGRHAGARNTGNADPVALPAASPIAQLRLDADGTPLAVTRDGELLRHGSGDWQSLGIGLDPAVPVAIGHGRIVGRGRQGGLWVHEAGRVHESDLPKLAPHAGLLVLSFAVIAVAPHGDRTFRVVRLEPLGDRWMESARSLEAVIPDARPVQFDPDGSGAGVAADANGHVVVFAGPDDSRYRHGVLGDAIEPTVMLLLERHELRPISSIALPAPHVFEDIAPRPIDWGDRRALLTMRAGPLGGQLCVVARSPGALHRFEIAALGEPIGIPNRWLSPSTDGNRLVAVLTPHIGGVLHRYRRAGDRLPGEVLARGVSNHAIGARDLDVSAWVGARWVTPTQDRHGLRVIDVDAPPTADSRTLVRLNAPVTALHPWRRGSASGVATLLADGTAWWVGLGD